MARKAILQAMQNIADDRTRWRRNHADALWQKRQGLFAVRIKQPLRRQHSAAFLKQRHQGPNAGWFEVINDDLIG